MNYTWIFSFYVFYLHIHSLHVWVSLCPFVFNKHQNSGTNRAQSLCGTSHDPRELLYMRRIKKNCLQTFLSSKNFKNSQKNIINSRTFLNWCLLFTKRRCPQITPQFKVEIVWLKSLVMWKELSFSYKLWFSNTYIFATWWY